MRYIDEYRLGLMISLALATSTYTLANTLGLPGPIGVVAAGLLIGSHATRYAMSEQTQTRLITFWSLVNELLNALLFLLIGFELLSLQLDRVAGVAALAALPLALLMRGISVVAPTYWLHMYRPKRWAAATVLTWGRAARRHLGHAGTDAAGDKVARADPVCVLRGGGVH